MTPQELWDKWVDPYHMISPKDKSRELFLKDVEAMTNLSNMTLEDVFNISAPLFEDDMVRQHYRSIIQQLDWKIKEALAATKNALPS